MIRTPDKTVGVARTDGPSILELAQLRLAELEIQLTKMDSIRTEADVLRRMINAAYAEM